MTKQIFYSIKVSALAIVLSFGLSYAYAWTAPTATPPTGNVSAPINTSSTVQAKTGNFTAPNLIDTSATVQTKTGGFNIATVSGNVGIGTTNPLSKLSVGGSGFTSTGVYGTGGNFGVYGYSTQYGVLGTTNGGTSGTGVYGTGGYFGVYGSGTYGVYGTGTYGVYGSGTVYGGVFNGSTAGITTSSCSGCSVLAEMAQVVETPTNGDIMCINPNTGKTEVCKKDKSDYIKGIAQKYAESIMRMGCSNTLDDAKNKRNGIIIGVMDTDTWTKKLECKGWYPIALSGLSEQTNVVCESPKGKQLGYGDILVTSFVPGHLRPLDKGENVEAYQIAGRADSICGLNKKTDSIQVWVK